MNMVRISKNLSNTESTRNYINQYCPYKMLHHDEFDYSILHLIRSMKKPGSQKNAKSYNDVIIMADTETSKKGQNGYRIEKGLKKVLPVQNHVCAWTISIRAYHANIVTLWGRHPSSMIESIKLILEQLPGQQTFIFFHNLSYDWTFLRKFFFNAFGFPVSQLNTKPHYPILIYFQNGLILRDSEILAQRSLQKWSADLHVEHQKAVGKWDYTKIRNQEEKFSDSELEYIEHDTLAGAECIDITCDILNKTLGTLPYTSTGIPREQMRKRGKSHSAHDHFLKLAPEWDEQLNLEMVYHGGYTHGNRYEIGIVNSGVQCFDFSSSYPYCLLVNKYPMEKFTKTDDCGPADILTYKDKYAFYFQFIVKGIDLKDPAFPMPALQYSKCIKTINEVQDNGRILCADLAVIWLTETDLEVISRYYKWESAICKNVMFAEKAYLPRWFTDYVYECYSRKCTGKGGDPVLYAILKSVVNSLYGMTVQKPVRDDIAEDYDSGLYEKMPVNYEEKYNKYLENRGSVLPYTAGVWCTAYAFRNLFDLGECAGIWLYSDTDSCYGINWNYRKVEKYNERCRKLLQENGYAGVEYNGRTYYPGVAETEGDKDRYTEFVVLGSKRYCGRSKADGQLHITVAGVPKKGAEELNDDILNFQPGFIFRGENTGKLTHSYIFVNEIYTDENGNETGDSVDLNPCDYLLDATDHFDLDELIKDDIVIQVYEDE